MSSSHLSLLPAIDIEGTFYGNRGIAISAVKLFSTLVASLFCISTAAFAALPVSAAAPDDPGVIAYVQRSTANIRLISPDGSGDRLLWTAPASENKTPAIELAWRPDGRELAFISTHENTCSWYDSDIFAIRSDGLPPHHQLAGLRRALYSAPGRSDGQRHQLHE